MTDPLLSVVVPFYGVEAYIGDCLESIAVQSYRNIDVVMVDDGSPDGSRAVAQEWADKDSRFRIVTKENGGLGPARNTGTENTDGDYITFIDSDDMVTRHSFELMMSTIENSGSSMVLSNARRFSRTSGVRQSWTHQGVARQTVLGTHIIERPALVRDRMVWNKIYRRSFWDEHGYEFPPIRYEDYPVTLKAHLEALTVDIVSSHCYYWRERESGDSITQQVFKYGNMLDRVVSAEMVLDIADAQATPQVRKRLHDYLGEIDFVSLVQAFSAVPDDEAQPVLDLCHRLTDRLTRFDIKSRPRLDQLQYHALKANDVELLRELAIFRRDGGNLGGVLAHRKRTRPWRYEAEFPGRGRSTAPRSTYEYPITSLVQRTAVTDVRWDGGTLVLQGQAEIAHLANDADSDIRVNLINGIDRHPLPLRRFDAVDQHANRAPVGFEARVDLDRLAAGRTLVWPLRFEVETTVQGIHRVGLLRGARGGSPNFPPGRWLGEEWVQPGVASGGMFTLRSEADPVVVDEIVSTATGFRFTGRIPGVCRHAVLELARRRPLADLQAVCQLQLGRDGTRFTGELSVQQVLDGDSPDDPFTLASMRQLKLVTDLGEFPLLWPGYSRDAGLSLGDRLVTVTRSTYGAAVLQHTPLRPSTQRITLSDNMVEASGVWWPGAEPTWMAWRRFVPGSDDHVDVDATPVPAADGTWTSRTPMELLVPPTDERTAVAPGAPDADWTLFAGIGEAEVAVAAEPGVIQQMPQEVRAGSRWFTLTSIAGTVRTQVR